MTCLPQFSTAIVSISFCLVDYCMWTCAQLSVTMALFTCRHDRAPLTEHQPTRQDSASSCSVRACSLGLNYCDRCRGSWSRLERFLFQSNTHHEHESRRMKQMCLYSVDQCTSLCGSVTKEQLKYSYCRFIMHRLHTIEQILQRLFFKRISPTYDVI